MVSKISKGRPSGYTKELAEEICETISTTSKSIKLLCKEHPNWPCADTIFRWRKTNKDFSDSYARAKEQQIETLVDEILDIADDSSSDFYENSAGSLVINHDNIQRAKLRIDTRKWLASKLVPKLYGDKPQHETTSTNEEILGNIGLIRKMYTKEY